MSNDIVDILMNATFWLMGFAAGIAIGGIFE